MTKRDIIIIPDPVLREVCEPVAKVDDSVRALADDMLETMYEAPGIGLAASQIGILQRLFVLDVAKEDEPKTRLSSLTRRSSGRARKPPSTRKAACRSPNITRMSNGRPG